MPDEKLREDDPRCDICCRPKSLHIARDLQCPETVYFRHMPEPVARAPDPTTAMLVGALQYARNLIGPDEVVDAALKQAEAEKQDE